MAEGIYLLVEDDGDENKWDDDADVELENELLITSGEASSEYKLSSFLDDEVGELV
jgi:hypothetical protein